MLYDDITSEVLVSNLATRYPIAAIISVEGGTVVGSLGMGKDSIMCNLALLNRLWDGGRMAVDRQTRESTIITGARLTVSLQIQSETLRHFYP